MALLDGTFGYGEGYGFSDGAGSGYGFGYSLSACRAAYLVALIEQAALAWTEAQRLRLITCQRDFRIRLCFWWSDAEGRPCNGGQSSSIAAPGQIEEVPGPLTICTGRALHGTSDPTRWLGQRLWLVAMHGPVQQVEDKIGALRREILGEILYDPTRI